MRSAWLAAAIAAAGIVAGCSSSPPAEQPVTQEPQPAGHGSLAHCLNEHGVPAAPGPGGAAPPGVAEQTWKDAMSACSSLAPGPAS